MVSIFDSAGRKWEPNAYVNMYSRTESGNIEVDTTLHEMDTLDMDIVKVSSHNTKTPICQQYEGRYLSKNGLTPELPVLTVKPRFHPNCLHRLLPATDYKRSMSNTNRHRDKKLVSQKKQWSKGDKKTVKKQEKYIKINRK
jgi:hypothetical protein